MVTSEELKKMFEGRIALQEVRYVGKTCFGRLEGELRGKVELERGPMDLGFSRIHVSVLERTSGLVDQMKFLISNVTGVKKGLYENRFLSLEFHVYDHEGSWNCEMGEADYEKLAEAINGYLEMFQSEEQIHGQNQEQAEAEGLSGQILL
ncbi:hypothetical protein [Hungatella hathewayi]|uniref:hypothetical protein n=1 Tax=Hungatella hathewayi TaxID=154046 RepID=UPI003567583B